jgi:hypothetical protein
MLTLVPEFIGMTSALRIFGISLRVTFIGICALMAIMAIGLFDAGLLGAIRISLASSSGFW